MNESDLKIRTKQFGLRVMKLADSLPNTTAGRAMGGQLIRSGTSVSANYRAACRACSKAEFVAKAGIVAEEADESALWMELIMDGGLLARDVVMPLHDKAEELTAIFVASGRTARQKDTCNATGNHQPAIRNCLFNPQSAIRNRKSSASGQAMVELAVGLVVILILFAGLIQLGRLANAHTQTMITARYDAGQDAMSTNDETAAAMYILSWAEGSDSNSYTADDFPFLAMNAESAATEITSLSRPDEIEGFVSGNPFNDVQDPAEIMAAFSMVRGDSYDSIPTIPVIRSLIYNRPALFTESHAWLVRTQGIY